MDNDYPHHHHHKDTKSSETSWCGHCNGSVYLSLPWLLIANHVRMFINNDDKTFKILSCFRKHERFMGQLLNSASHSLELQEFQLILINKNILASCQAERVEVHIHTRFVETRPCFQYLGMKCASVTLHSRDVTRINWIKIMVQSVPSGEKEFRKCKLKASDRNDSVCLYLLVA